MTDKKEKKKSLAWLWWTIAIVVILGILGAYIAFKMSPVGRVNSVLGKISNKTGLNVQNIARKTALSSLTGGVL